MKMLCDGEVKMMDSSEKEFTLKSHNLCHHHLGLFALSGQIKGKSGCVVCIDGTCYTLASIPPAGVSALWASEGSSDDSLLASSSPLPCATSSGPWLSARQKSFLHL